VSVSEAKTLVLKTGFWQGNFVNLSQWTCVCVCVCVCVYVFHLGQGWLHKARTEPNIWEQSQELLHTIVHCLNDAFDYLNEQLFVLHTHKTVKDYQWFWDWACSCGAISHSLLSWFLGGSFTANRKAHIAEIKLCISRNLTNASDFSECAHTNCVK